MKKVVVTGGSGKFGTQVVKELLEHHYEVVSVDQQEPKERLCRSIVIDSLNMGQICGALSDAEAVIHLAAIPRPYGHPNEVVFQNNVISTYNVLEAASIVGIQKAVTASSLCAYGMVFAPHAFDPKYLPLDEDHPVLPQDSYGLSKVVDEMTADAFHRRTNMSVISMRLTAVIDPEDYRDFPGDPASDQNKRELWSYVDARDAARACRLAIEVEDLGRETFNLIADDNKTEMKSEALLHTYYPNVGDIRHHFSAFETLVCNKKAKRMLHWQPVHRWRDNISTEN